MQETCVHSLCWEDSPGERKGYPLQYSGLENSMDLFIIWGCPDSSVGKESTCNAGDPGSIPGLGGSAGEGIGYSLQYSWASHVAQLVKNLPAVWETWVQSLGWEDLWRRAWQPTPVFLPGESPWTKEDRGAWQATVHGVTKSQTRLKQLSTHAMYTQHSHTQ